MANKANDNTIFCETVTNTVCIFSVYRYEHTFYTTKCNIAIISENRIKSFSLFQNF